MTVNSGLTCAPCVTDLALVREAVTSVAGTACCQAHAVLLTYPHDNPGRRRARVEQLRDLAEAKMEMASEPEKAALELLVAEYALIAVMDMGGNRDAQPGQARRDGQREANREPRTPREPRSGAPREPREPREAGADSEGRGRRGRRGRPERPTGEHGEPHTGPVSLGDSGAIPPAAGSETPSAPTPGTPTPSSGSTSPEPTSTEPTGTATHRVGWHRVSWQRADEHVPFGGCSGSSSRCTGQCAAVNP